MHSASSRLNSITLYAGIILAVMCIVNYSHGLFMQNPQPDIKFQVIEVTNFIPTAKWEVASFKYNLAANLSSLYTWNLKQLFVYIEVQWTNPRNNFNSSVIVSDWILNDIEDRSKIKDSFVISVKNKPIQYSVRDVHSGLKGTFAKISINAEYMPHVGLFKKIRLYEQDFRFPTSYTNSK